jgi:hypothetical protein
LARKKPERVDKAKNQAAFLAAFRSCGRIDVSAKAAGITSQAHYLWIKKDPEYKRIFAEAREEAVAYLEDEAHRRAVEGTTEDIYYQGEVCGTKLNYSDTLLIFLLKAANPEKYRDRFDIRSKVESIGEQPPLVAMVSEVFTASEIERMIDRMTDQHGSEGRVNGKG